jgi:3-hydroxyethyl bacteriochlorophyllide a dehydrogenase
MVALTVPNPSPGAATAPAESAPRARALAVVLERPEQLALTPLDIDHPGPGDVVIATEWSAISTGTERLLYQGRMPPFPGMGYPLVPGYEAVGRISAVGPEAGSAVRVGQRVFVGGARCYGEVRGLFGGAAARLVVPATRAIPVPEFLGERAVLLALAATAYHALRLPGARRPELIVGHGVLGRLLARIAALDTSAPVVVWENNPERAQGAMGYVVTDARQDTRRDYRAILDASGDAALLDQLIARLAPGGEIVLAGFYSEPLHFNFAPAFMREARLLIAAEWRPDDLRAVMELIASGHLSLDGLITHRQPAVEAPAAYRTAFGDPACLKMVLDWRSLA